MTSRERILATIAGEKTDYTPLAMLLFSGLRQRCADEQEFVERQLALGIDAIAALPTLELSPHPEVTTRTWLELAAPHPLLHKVYQTPAGELEVIVEKTEDWPHGNDIPLMTDHTVPRARKFLVTEAKDLAALAYVLPEPTLAGIEAFRREARKVARFAEQRQVATRAGFQRLSDMLVWLAGCEALATLGLTDPEFFTAFVELVARWQERQIAVLLEARSDILVGPQWYATTFMSPVLYERFLSPALRRRVAWTHEAGGKFCALATTNVMTFIPTLKELGIDMLFGVDPRQGGWDLVRAKRELGDTVCLWGGVNGYLTMVDGSAAEVERAVEAALATLAPGGRFILAVVDDVRIDEPATATWDEVWSRMERMVETWKRLR
jgi:hypothetical protein